MLLAEMVTAGEQLLFGDHQFYNVLITSYSMVMASWSAYMQYSGHAAGQQSPVAASVVIVGAQPLLVVTVVGHSPTLQATAQQCCADFGVF